MESLPSPLFSLILNELRPTGSSKGDILSLFFTSKNIMEKYISCFVKILTFNFSKLDEIKKISDIVFKNIKKIEVKWEYNVEALPSSVEYLLFHDRPDDNNKYVFPEGLLELHFGKYYDPEIKKLPESLISLSFGKHFDGFIEVYPSGLKYLEFGEHFNQNIDSLPDSIVYLILGEGFGLEIKKLPKCLEKISVFEHYSHMEDLEKLCSLSNIDMDCYALYYI